MPFGQNSDIYMLININENAIIKKILKERRRRAIMIIITARCCELQVVRIKEEGSVHVSVLTELKCSYATSSLHRISSCDQYWHWCNRSKHKQGKRWLYTHYFTEEQPFEIETKKQAYYMSDMKYAIHMLTNLNPVLSFLVENIHH